METTHGQNSYSGTMVKNIIDMTPEERKEYYAQSQERVKQLLFAKGQPLVQEVGDYTVAEHSDGRIERIRKIANLSLIERIRYFVSDNFSIFLSKIRIQLKRMIRKFTGKKKSDW